jgi:type IV pilus assembly protein PilQ
MRKLQWIGLALLFQVAVWGCAETKKSLPPPDVAQKPFENWQSMGETSPGHSPQAPAASTPAPAELSPNPNQTATVNPAALNPAAAAKQERSLPTNKVSLRMHNADTVVVLRALARSVGVNILLNEKVKGAVSVDLENVPWDQAFLGILHSEGLDYTWEGNMLRVMTAEDMANEAKIASIRPLQIRVIPIHFANADKLQEKLKDTLTKDENGKVRGNVTWDEYTNSLIIKADAYELPRMVALVESLDRPTAQIHIVSNIVEATKDATRDLGIQWGGLYHSGKTYVTPGGTSGTVNSTTGQVTYTPFTGTSGISGQGFGVNLPAAPINGVNPSSVGLLLGTIGGNILDMQLSALQQLGKVNILSTPSLTTLDNQKAYTQDGQAVPVASLTTTGQASVTYIDAVIKLEITPHVISGNILKLNVVITKNEPDFSVTVQGNPLIQKKETSTTMICADGETVVISGLSLQQKTVTDTGVPGFQNIPLLGAAFKSSLNDNQFQDVLIFITPHILKDRSES